MSDIIRISTASTNENLNKNLIAHGFLPNGIPTFGPPEALARYNAQVRCYTFSKNEASYDRISYEITVSDGEYKFHCTLNDGDYITKNSSGQKIPCRLMTDVELDMYDLFSSIFLCVNVYVAVDSIGLPITK